MHSTLGRRRRMPQRPHSVFRALPSEPPRLARHAVVTRPAPLPAPCLPRPRLIWTPALHRRFLESVEKVGGVDRALPKAVMKVGPGRGASPAV